MQKFNTILYINIADPNIKIINPISVSDSPTEKYFDGHDIVSFLYEQSIFIDLLNSP